MDRKAHTLYPLSIGYVHTVQFDFTNLSADWFKENQLEGICGFSSEPFSKRYIKCASDTGSSSLIHTQVYTNLQISLSYSLYWNTFGSSI